MGHFFKQVVDSGVSVKLISLALWQSQESLVYALKPAYFIHGYASVFPNKLQKSYPGNKMG